MATIHRGSRIQEARAPRPPWAGPPHIGRAPNVDPFLKTGIEAPQVARVERGPVSRDRPLGDLVDPRAQPLDGVLDDPRANLHLTILKEYLGRPAVAAARKRDPEAHRRVLLVQRH